MFFDLTLPLSPDLAADAQGKEPKAFSGHLGTHFDVMDQTSTIWSGRVWSSTSAPPPTGRSTCQTLPPTP